MRFGAHVSMAGGLWNAPKNAQKIDCEILQMFSRPPQGGKAKPLTDQLLEKWHASLEENQIEATYIHAPYYTNLASDKNRVRYSTSSVLRSELERGSKLGSTAVMFHPGSARAVGRKQGIQSVIDGLNRIMDDYEGSCQLLVEISAGAGEVMGDTFEEIAAFLEGAERGDDIGVCFDTQHAFASGYDLTEPKAANKIIDTFDKIVGLGKLTCIHLNDSKVKLGSNKDRHENLGKGKIGLASIKEFVTHPALKDMDFLLETPTKGDRKGEIAQLKSWRKQVYA